MFFFSSRRRHTRYIGDWSSDVCSSDLAGFKGSVERGASCNCELITLIPHCNGTHTECVGHLTRERLDAWRVVPAGFLPALLRSEERRVGKEGGTRGWT